MSKVRLTYVHTNDPENPIKGYLQSDHVIISCIGKTEDEVFKKLCKNNIIITKNFQKYEILYLKSVDY